MRNTTIVLTTYTRGMAAVAIRCFDGTKEHCVSFEDIMDSCHVSENTYDDYIAEIKASKDYIAAVAVYDSEYTLLKTMTFKSITEKR